MFKQTSSPLNSDRLCLRAAPKPLTRFFHMLWFVSFLFFYISCTKKQIKGFQLNNVHCMQTSLQRWVKKCYENVVLFPLEQSAKTTTKSSTTTSEYDNRSRSCNVKCLNYCGFHSIKQSTSHISLKTNPFPVTIATWLFLLLCNSLNLSTSSLLFIQPYFSITSHKMHFKSNIYHKCFTLTLHIIQQYFLKTAYYRSTACVQFM